MKMTPMVRKCVQFNKLPNNNSKNCASYISFTVSLERLFYYNHTNQLKYKETLAILLNYSLVTLSLISDIFQVTVHEYLLTCTVKLSINTAFIPHIDTSLIICNIVEKVIINIQYYRLPWIKPRGRCCRYLFIILREQLRITWKFHYINIIFLCQFKFNIIL